ncbi:putative protease S8 tripeptidyl peptidase I [Rhizodiscina lignyota]|uniref:Protease S8 tripeptidyl peptidase I n=1 Tax=Rhizodiscina lignyota TaxID=1504668 RepID=A0A9P4IGL6_9PEZI|nr:putative protease S8 tripeptidyl peptidase I [Rhizodiscina lignyota]
MKRTLWATIALAALAGARPTPDNSYELHEERDGSLHAWIKRDRVFPHAVMPMKIGLTQQNLEKGYQHLIDVSDPDSPNYSKHWTEEEVHELFAPSKDTIETVSQWLADSGISSDRILHSANRGWLHFNATAKEAEELLKAEFYEHEHVSNGKWSVACDKYHLPSHIRQHVDYVTPGVKTSQLRKTTSGLSKRASPSFGWGPGHHRPPMWKPWHPGHGSQDLKDCDVTITPACIAALYHIPEPAKNVAPGNALGIFEEGDFYAQEDLDLFFSNFTKYIPNGTHPTLKSIDGGVAPTTNVSNAGGESDLDFQLAYPIVYPQEIVVYQVDDIPYATFEIPTAGFGNTFLDALDGSYCNYTAFGVTGDDPVLDPTYPDPAPGGYKGPLMCGTYKPTNVISISYGVQEIDLPANYQKRQCNEFLKLGLQGTSVFVASGDTGVAGVQSSNGTGPNGCLGPKDNVFNPTNPNSCPYLTNVGATMITPGNTVNDPESAAFGLFHNNTVVFTSSGGFSNIYPIPDYQKSAVDTYFKEHNPPYPYYELLDGFNASKAGDGIYNRIGHGIPDVAANGLEIAVYVGGEAITEAGTSASSPIFAAIVTRINDARLNMGKKPIGFINPALYKNPWILNDITNGTNPGCNTDGFKAVKGWDPVTGLGTPNYPKMLEYFTKLQ